MLRFSFFMWDPTVCKLLLVVKNWGSVLGHTIFFCCLLLIWKMALSLFKFESLAHLSSSAYHLEVSWDSRLLRAQEIPGKWKKILMIVKYQYQHLCALGRVMHKEEASLKCGQCAGAAQRASSAGPRLWDGCGLGVYGQRIWHTFHFWNVYILFMYLMHLSKVTYSTEKE